jgi:hypothetical protein
MKKLLILLALSASMMACNSNTKNEAASDTASDTAATTDPGENTSAAAQQSSVDTNATKIGTNPTVPDTTKKDSLPKH